MYFERELCLILAVRLGKSRISRIENIYKTILRFDLKVMKRLLIIVLLFIKLEPSLQADRRQRLAYNFLHHPSILFKASSHFHLYTQIFSFFRVKNLHYDGLETTRQQMSEQKKALDLSNDESFIDRRHKRDALFDECLEIHMPNGTFNFNEYLNCLEEFEKRGIPNPPDFDDE